MFLCFNHLGLFFVPVSCDRGSNSYQSNNENVVRLKYESLDKRLRLAQIVRIKSVADNKMQLALAVFFYFTHNVFKYNPGTHNLKKVYVALTPSV